MKSTGVWAEVELGITDIEINAALQMRAIDPPSEEYHELLAKNKTAWPFPPVRVIKFGDRNLLVEGFTRLRAAADAGRKTVPVEIRLGTWREAILEACASNVDHGYRRTSSDKRRAVLRAIEEGITGKTELAQVCRVSRAMVYTVVEEQERRADVAPKSKRGTKSKPVSERTERCPVCNSCAWEASDAGYVCGVCQHIDGEVVSGEPEELEERVDRESGINNDLKSLKADFGRLVRSLKKCGIDADRPVKAINKLITEAIEGVLT